ncbi:MAG: hypothetical protein NUV65_02395 [Candidatus Roizmanbacteria bacterium]|nr:hypothetical protein [Candidatus Roizmanbacteria bacterium]
MVFWIITWLAFWFGGMGLPIYLYEKYKITFYKYPWQHTLFYVFLLILLYVVYQQHFSVYFNNLSLSYISVVLVLFLLWILVPITYQNDYYTKHERQGYQLPKFFEILFQQVCFLGGLLTCGLAPTIFGLAFFAVHVPFFLFIRKKFALFTTSSSLIGGVIFAHLQSIGMVGFLIALSIHVFFYVSAHYALSKKQFLGIEPFKR